MIASPMLNVASGSRSCKSLLSDRSPPIGGILAHFYGRKGVTNGRDDHATLIKTTLTVSASYKRTSISGDWMSVCSHKRSFVGALGVQNQGTGWLQRGCSSLGVERWYDSPEFGVIWEMSVQKLSTDSRTTFQRQCSEPNVRSSELRVRNTECLDPM